MEDFGEKIVANPGEIIMTVLCMDRVILSIVASSASVMQLLVRSFIIIEIRIGIIKIPH